MKSHLQVFFYQSSSKISKREKGSKGFCKGIKKRKWVLREYQMTNSSCRLFCQLKWILLYFHEGNSLLKEDLLHPPWQCINNNTPNFQTNSLITKLLYKNSKSSLKPNVGEKIKLASSCL